LLTWFGLRIVSLALWGSSDPGRPLGDQRSTCKSTGLKFPGV